MVLGNTESELFSGFLAVGLPPRLVPAALLAALFPAMAVTTENEEMTVLTDLSLKLGIFLAGSRDLIQKFLTLRLQLLKLFSDLGELFVIGA